MRATADGAVLRHGLVDGRHLDGGIEEAVEVQAVELGVVQSERFAAWAEEVGFRLPVGFERRLLEVRRVVHAGFFSADDGARQRLAGGLEVVVGGVELRGTEVREEVVGALAQVGQGADVRGGFGEAVGEDGGADEHGGAGGAELVDGP